MTITLSPGHTQYLLFSEALKDVAGRRFEQHDHPVVVLDRATGPTTRVWGWWTPGHPARPCLLWSSGRGWGTTVVEPDTLDAEGYERAFWSHRIKLLDLALANALGPVATLEDLELHATLTCFGLGSDGVRHQAAVLWGVRHLRAATASSPSGTVRPSDRPTRAGIDGVVDDELARHALIPTLAKSRPSMA
jgi:hypothetical protein